MKRYAFAVYREWSFNIFSEVMNQCNEIDECEILVLITTAEHEFVLPISTGLQVEIIDGKDPAQLSEILAKHKIDTVFFYGWSWIVREPVLSDYVCLCLHPSPLPKYRGGTPLQHQIIAGETTSAVSIIRMSTGIDDGDLYTQIPFSLLGTLKAILGRMTDLGVVATVQYIEDSLNDEVIFTPQLNLENNPALRRRMPTDGEIHLSQTQEQTYRYINNVVRSLCDPYPNAYITFSDGILQVQGVQKRKYVRSQNIILTPDTKMEILEVGKNLLLKVTDGYALITKSKFVTIK